MNARSKTTPKVKGIIPGRKSKSDAMVMISSCLKRFSHFRKVTDVVNGKDVGVENVTL